jgi:predicted MarR family transcription regulator
LLSALNCSSIAYVLLYALRFWDSSIYLELGLALAKLCLSLERTDINTKIYCLRTLYARYAFRKKSNLLSALNCSSIAYVLLYALRFWDSSIYLELGLALAKLCLSLERTDINTKIYCLRTLYARYAFRKKSNLLSALNFSSITYVLLICVTLLEKNLTYSLR